MQQFVKDVREARTECLEHSKTVSKYQKIFY